MKRLTRRTVHTPPRTILRSALPSPDLSGNILNHHFPDVAAFAVQHGSRGIDRHPDHGFRRDEGRWWRDKLHRIHFDIQKRRARMREPNLDRFFESAGFRDAAS